MMLRLGGAAFEELVAIGDAEELCRRLLASPWGWGSSTRYAEAVELLGKVQGTGELPMSFVALMLCTCRRWDRVTTRLIAAIEDSGLLDSTGLDELAESLLSHEQVIASVRLTAIDQLCELDGPETARRRALSDPNATVRKWRAPAPELRPSLFEA